MPYRHREIGGIPILSLTSALDWVGGKRHAPADLPPGKRSGTHCIGCWVGLRAGLDGCGKSRPTGIRSPDRPARSESLYRLSYPGPHMHVTNVITRGTEISHSCYTVRIPIYTKCTNILHNPEYCLFFPEMAAQKFGSLNRQCLASLPTNQRPIRIYRI